MAETDIVRQKKSVKSVEPVEPTTLFFTLSLNDIANKIETVLGFDMGRIPNQLMNKGSNHSLATTAFHYFMNSTVETIASPAIRKVMASDMIRVSFAVSSLVLNFILYLKVVNLLIGFDRILT